MEVKIIGNSSSEPQPFTFNIGFIDTVIDKEIVKNDLMKKYFFDSAKASMWIYYNFNVLKELIYSRLNMVHNVNDFMVAEVYEDELECLILNWKGRVWKI